MSNVSTDAPIRERVRKEMELNDPPIEVGQIWQSKDVGDTIYRRIRILAPYPTGGPLKREENLWLYEELPGGKYKLEIGRLGLFPEFNLRYFATLETGDGDES